MRKKTIYCIIIFVLTISMLISGCATESKENSTATTKASATATSSSSASFTVEKEGVLSGYPLDLLPLFKIVKVGSCSFTMRNDANYVIGKDLYTLNYQSEGTIEEISKYYKEIVKDIDPDYNKVDFFEGRINGHKVVITLYDEGEGITNVSILFGLRAGDYVSENPYFSNYPKDLIEVKANSDLIQRKFELRSTTYSKKITMYYIDTYTTKASVEEIKIFYSEKYKAAESYHYSEDNSGITYMWVNQGYSCRVYVNKADFNSLRSYHIEVSKEK